MLKKVIASLIRRGELRYTYHFGNTYLETYYDRPRQVSDHVVLRPPKTRCPSVQGQLVVTLARGASFGGGDHPTTRLAIQLLDAMLHGQIWQKRKTQANALDIGTGSGVLAIVAAKLGIGRVDAIDTDPCARFEARANIRLNHLEKRVTMIDGSLGAVNGRHELVLANLRTPTLIDFYQQLETCLTDDCVLLFSGMKADEMPSVQNFYENAGFSIQKERTENGWGALCAARGDFSAAGLKPRVGH
jgi:ribosomal protein L11 methyltransferase